jgi:hypothetical protein
MQTNNHFSNLKSIKTLRELTLITSFDVGIVSSNQLCDSVCVKFPRLGKISATRASAASSQIRDSRLARLAPRPTLRPTLQASVMQAVPAQWYTWRLATSGVGDWVRRGHTARVTASGVDIRCECVRALVRELDNRPRCAHVWAWTRKAMGYTPPPLPPHPII